MSRPNRFLIALGQSLSTMGLYAAGHPARERGVDLTFNRLLDLLSDVQCAEFSFMDVGVAYRGRELEEMRQWDWAPRLSAASVGRLEVDADVTREQWAAALEQMASLLGAGTLSSAEARPMAATAVRIGALKVLSDAPTETSQPSSAASLLFEDTDESLDPDLLATLRDDAATVDWIHAEALQSERLPMAEVEAVVASMASAMHGERRMLFPLLAMKSFDEYTTTHACNVAMLAMGLAEELGCSRREVRAFGVAGLLHDIGKITIPKEILTKPGRLTPQEKAVMNTHPAEGARLLLERERGLQLPAVVAYEHHICLDGNGYPRLHFGRGCHLASRLVHVCDIFDALTTNRPYRKPWTAEQTLTFLASREGSETDPVLSQAFARVVRRGQITPVPLSPDATPEPPEPMT
ncbi:MAG: HD domain-containing protein [Gemmatimonadetes bacterium]|nr:HD domain-containing protein [Gemmatimonadota bacterium]